MMQFLNDLYALKKATKKSADEIESISSGNDLRTENFVNPDFFEKLAFIAEHYGMYLVLGIGLICLCVYVYFTTDDDNEL